MAPDRAGDKELLRARLRAARRAWSEAVDPAGRRDRAERLAAAVLRHPSVERACRERRAITCFVSLPAEPPTEAVLEGLLESGADVLLPVIEGDRALAWGRYSSRESLRMAALGILEPAGAPAARTPGELLAMRPAVLLVPALAVDGSGARLGQGGGYYDATLAALRQAEQPPLALALVGPDEVLPAGSIPTEPHDQGVDGWITG